MKIINIPGSKSIIQRLLIIASYLENKIIFENWSNCTDVQTLMEAFDNLGIEVLIHNHTAIVCSSKLKKNNFLKIKIKDSATSARFLFARLSTIENQYLFSLSKQLQIRPHKILIDILNKNGAKIYPINADYKIIGEKYLNGGKLEIDASISSQFISALLLITPSYKNDLELILNNNIVSFPYIKMTIKLMRIFGIEVTYINNRIFIKSGQKYKNIGNLYIEPDYSSAAYLLVLGALKYNNGLYIKKYRDFPIQGDFHIVDILKQMGGKFFEGESYLGFKKSDLNGIKLNMQNYPDLVPILVIASLFANGESEFRNISHLKYKESDRLIFLSLIHI